MKRTAFLVAVCVLAGGVHARAQGDEQSRRRLVDSLQRYASSPERAVERRRYLTMLARGRQLWRRARVTDYDLQATSRGGFPGPGGVGKLFPRGVLTTVHNGVVVDRRGGGKDSNAGFAPETIDALFAAVEADIRIQGRAVRELALHPRYGFPLRYFSDSPVYSDHEQIFAVDSFAVLSRARASALSRADSALVGQMLLAEDRRDSTDAALSAGAKHRDARIREIARRARIRIRDTRATGRDSLEKAPEPLMWEERYWKLWYRELKAPASDCSQLHGALGSPPPPEMWHYRLRAADLITAVCAPDDYIAAILRHWIDGLPADASRRTSDSVSWHAAAHALVALARMRPDEARPRVTAMATHGEWHVRAYAARAASVLGDTTTLRTLARDRIDNVKEQAIDALAKLTGHADDSLFVAALGADGAPAVRAAAIALEGSPRVDVAALANATFERWVARQNASARDVRVALLELAGRPPSDDRPPVVAHALPPRAVALALGAYVRLVVRMSPASGGDSFVVRLRGDAAPMMSARILELVKAHYYDGTDWHRVEPDFVIQGGGPGSNEYSGAPQYLRDELGRVPHLRGTIGMSTRGHDTGDAQWFVNLKDNRRLDRDYTVFAEVVDGMEVVDEIQEGDVIATIEEVKIP